MIKLLTNFEPGQSSFSQRIWILLWFGVGQVYGLCEYAISVGHSAITRADRRNRIVIALQLVGILGTGACAVGGFVVAIQMMLDDEVCRVF